MRRIRVAWLLVLGTFGVAVSAADATETPPPTSWPSNDSVRPRIEAGPHSLRFYGDNRYQTALSATLLLRGSGTSDSYPFGNPDPATPRGWWGLSTCPRSIIVVAGDNPADALAANTLSDPTGSSTEPYLQRSAAADPLFFPPGGFARVDTDFAPVLTTTSARDGATQLDLATRLAAQDVSRGGCTTAKQAIIVGGVRAIASSVEAELVSIGYDEVFRVAGSSRYQTARLVAEALGTAVAPGTPTRTACVDASSRGGARAAYYANSVIEYRESVDSCRVLSRTVVLADGVDGVDALASGWWTSFWQVPLLLTNGTSALPVQTREALLTLDVDTLIVLGGEARIPQQVVDHAVDLSGATTQIRVAGDDRYATSMEMARRFGGWWSTGRFADAAGSSICVAASGGGAGASGWPDALAAGPWCSRAAVARGPLGAPDRALAPMAGGSGAILSQADDGGLATHLFVPMILVRAATGTLPTSVATGIGGIFPADEAVCSGSQAPEGCVPPGFVYVAGGPNVVSPGAVSALTELVSGGLSGSEQELPTLASAFVTRLDLSPIYAQPEDAEAGGPFVCLARGSYSGARWVSVAGQTRVNLDLVGRGLYGVDADGVTRSPGVGAPVCLAPDVDSRTPVSVWTSGPWGGSSQVRGLDTASGRRFSLSADLVAGPPAASSGLDSAVDPGSGGSTTWRFVTEPSSGTATSRGASAVLTRAEVSIALVRGRDRTDSAGVDTFEANVELTTAQGLVRATVSGEAILDGGTWTLRGVADFDRGTWTFDSGLGGFAAEVTVGDVGSADDVLAWRLDGQA